MRMLFEALVLVAALSIDSFVASLGFGSEKIKIPIRSILAISGVCTCILGISLMGGAFLKPYLSEGAAAIVSFVVLFLIGLVRLLDSLIKRKIGKSYEGKANLKFKFLSFECMLLIYSDSNMADMDGSREISLAEAVTLAFALSVDGIAAGFGAGITDVSYLAIVLLSFVTGILCITLGRYLGETIAGKLNVDLSSVGGLVLIALAISKLM